MEQEPLIEHLKQEQIIRFRRLLTDYKDGMPAEIKHSTSLDSGWKVQKGVWFQIVAGRIETLLDEQLSGKNIISEKLHNEAAGLFNKITGTSFKEALLTTPEDIIEAETVIKKIIAELENREN